MKVRAIAILAGLLALVTAGTAQAAAISGQGTWETTLLGRDLDGNAATYEAYYDTVLDITWLADTQLAASNTFGIGGLNADGTMTWEGVNWWIKGMNIDGGTGYLGSNTWRLPIALDLNLPDDSSYTDSSVLE